MWNVPVAFVSIVVSWLAAYSPGLTATPSTLKGSFVAPRADEKRRDDARILQYLGWQAHWTFLSLYAIMPPCLLMEPGWRFLPPPSQWHTFVDLWQHPWAVARYHCVKPFSELHYKLMGMYLKEVASLGQKTITATIVDKPWGQGNNYDLFHSMVEVTRRKDGTWTYDYSVFDKYVTFAKECGLGPQIHCYTLA